MAFPGLINMRDARWLEARMIIEAIKRWICAIVTPRVWQLDRVESDSH